MGAVCGAPGLVSASAKGSEDDPAQAKSRAIDKQLAKEKKVISIKMLLLGSGESGKSTIVKQMRILHTNGFSQDEYAQKRLLIYTNLITAMQTILEAMQARRLPFTHPDSQAMCDLIWLNNKSGHDLVPFPTDLSVALSTLWTDPAVHDTAHKCHTWGFQIDDGIFYFLDSAERVTHPDYVPTQNDALHARQQTMGVVEVNFTVKNTLLRVFDAGGQRSERRKWIHFFDNVNMVIFVSALSEYDQLLREDNRTNRMVESLRLFDVICNNPWFDSASIILFLNKKDLFAQKIQDTPLTTAFPDYPGGKNYVEAAGFVRHKFEGVNKKPGRNVYSHETCATDTDQVSKIISSITDMCLNEVMKMWTS